MLTQFSSAEYPPPVEQPVPTITHESHQPHGTDLIGRPILFDSGQFAGQTIRAELQEIQQAELGRKYARVDRRPLDPPPVVQLRLFEIFNAGSDQQTEREVRDYDEVQVLGLLCTVDLFPIPPRSNVVNRGDVADIGSQVEPPTPTSFSSPITPESQTSTKQPTATSRPYEISDSMTMVMDHSSPRGPTSSSPGFLPASNSSRDTVHYLNDFPVTENSKMTSALVGATFVQPSIVDFQGKKSIMFVFADLAVKVEGTFILRYRVFDIFSKPRNHSDLVIQAECYGGAFRVYSTKEFPGLQASTELTKQLARWGVRLNTRETERKRRKKDEPRSASPSYGGSAKRKLPSSDHVNITYGSDND